MNNKSKMEDESTNTDIISLYDGKIKISVCFICGGDAQTRQCESYDFSHWSLECASSLFKVLNLDPYLESVFHDVNYCQLCLQNNREINFLFRTIQNLQRQLEHYRCVIESSIKARVVNSDYPVDPLGQNEPSLSTILQYVRQEHDKLASTARNEFKNTHFEERIEAGYLGKKPIITIVESNRIRLLQRIERLRNSSQSTYLQQPVQKSTKFGRILPTPLESSSKAKKRNNLGKEVETDVRTKTTKIYCSYPECSFVCPRESRLNIHIRKIHLEDSTPYHCEHVGCGKKFRILQQLLGHVKFHRNRLEFKKSASDNYRQQPVIKISKSKHPKNLTNYRCFKCSEKFKSRSHCTLHIESVHGLRIGERVSESNTQIMEQIDEFDNHDSSDQDYYLNTEISSSGNGKKTDMTEPPKKFYCSYQGCEFVCRRENRLNIHYQKMHLEYTTPYQLGIVTNTSSFSENSTLEENEFQLPVSNKIRDGTKPFICLTVECRRSFRSQKAFECHLRKCHEKDPNPYRCFACPEKFQSVQLRTAHVKIVHGQSFEIYGQRNRASIYMNNPKGPPSQANAQLTCMECGFPFVNGDEFNLETHLELHKANEMENRKFACVLPSCSKEYVNSIHLKRHVTSEHAIIGIKCDLCDKILSSLMSLRKHRLTFHGATQSVDDFVCGECSYQGRTKKDLSDHMTKHSKTKQFQCNLCPETFKWRQSLRSHLIKHGPTDTWPYKCTFTGCEKRFYLSSKLKTHEETHSATRSYICEHCSNAFKTYKYLRTHILHVHVKMSWKTAKL